MSTCKWSALSQHDDVRVKPDRLQLQLLQWVWLVQELAACTKRNSMETTASDALCDPLLIVPFTLTVKMVLTACTSCRTLQGEDSRCLYDHAERNAIQTMGRH